MVIDESKLEDLHPVDAPPIVPGKMPLPYVARDVFQSGELPPVIGLQPDLARSGEQPVGIPTARLMPVAPSGFSGNNSAIHSVINTIVQGGTGTSVKLATNGIDNVDQVRLNLQESTNIVLTNDNAGNTDISAPDFTASGTGHSSGCVPDPGAVAGVTHFLREDATFAIPPVFVGSGASHAIGYVPDPGSSAGSTRFLCEDATFAIPPGTGGAANYQEVENSGTPVAPEPILNFLAPLVATDNSGNTSTDISVSIPAAVQLITTGTLTGNVSVTATTVTSIFAISMTMPSSGGPFRLFVSYSAYWTTIASNTQVNFWITIGANSFATSESGGGISPVPKGGNSCSQFTPVTYANGASVTATLFCEADQNITVRKSPTMGVNDTTLQAVAFPSV